MGLSCPSACIVVTAPSFAGASLRGTRPFAKNAKERGTHFAGRAGEVKGLGHPPVGAVGGGAIANGINPGATSGWSPASWVSQRYQSGLGSIGQWLGTGPTAASGGMSAALAGGGAAQVAQGGCQ